MSKKKRLLSQVLKYLRSLRRSRSKPLLNSPKRRKSLPSALSSCVLGIRTHSRIKMMSPLRNPSKRSRSQLLRSHLRQSPNLKSSSLSLSPKDSIFAIRLTKRTRDTCPRLIRVWKPRRKTQRRNNLEKKSLKENNQRRNTLLVFHSKNKSHSRLPP
jgi:hypothetical protein